MRRRAKTKEASLAVHVEVLQNGATLVRRSEPLKHSGTYALSSNPDEPFSVPHYPFPEGRLEFLRLAGGQATLLIDRKWEGFATSKGELVNIPRGDHGGRTVSLYKNDYASLSEGDLRIMVKLAPPLPPDKRSRHRLDPAYRSSLTRLLLPTIEEKRGLVAAAIAAAIVVGGLCAGLLQRPFVEPRGLDDIDQTYLLPFIAPEHLSQAPEALQFNLNRKDPVHGVLHFFRSFTDALMGWPVANQSLLYPTTVALYESLHAQARAVADQAEERQKEVDSLQSMKSGVSLLAIPTVVGETLGGSMLRVIDKIGIMEQGFADDLQSKTRIAAAVKNDTDYNYEQYKDLPADGRSSAEQAVEAKAVEALSGGWKRTTDEDAMYAEVAALAKRAKAAQERTLRSKTPADIVAPTDLAPLALPGGAKFATFTRDVDFRIADLKLYHLQGSEYGHTGAAPAPKEPLVGEIEPGLVERYIRENRYQLQLCYELALRRDELAAGTMEWKWRIDTRGLISDVALVSTSIKDPRMAECIRRKISTWRFPRPRRGSVEVSYPFEFAPTKG